MRLVFMRNSVVELNNEKPSLPPATIAQPKNKLHASSTSMSSTGLK